MFLLHCKNLTSIRFGEFFTLNLRLNTNTSHSLKLRESLSVMTAEKNVTSKETVKLITCKNREKKVWSNQIRTKDENTTTLVVNGEVVLLSVEEEECHVADTCVEWVIDLVASYYTTSHNEFFMMYKARDFGKVKMGNSNNANIVGINDVFIQTNTGYTLMFKDVRHVLYLRLNIISIHALDLVGFHNIFGDGK